ncbi:MAG TPA: hypothetical protein VMO81_00945 [Aestuariivirgaceae bacterium]|nr:hypothetical protein [Aestuariivirgaceae bacterium]
MTIASRTARGRPTPDTPAQPAWLFPGRTELAITVNWRLAAIEVMVRDLRLAREREEVKDSIQIARLRLLSARCELTLARCRTA